VLWLSGTVPEGSVFDHVEEKAWEINQRGYAWKNGC